MKPKTEYKSFNTDKTIEELKYNLLQQRERFRNLIIAQEFYKKLLNAPIFKSHKLNLFETLENFKSEFKNTAETNKELLNEIGMQLFQIDKKFECEDLVCDNFFTKEIDDLELKIHDFLLEMNALKLEMFEYLQDVIIDN
jgi:CII-binding regulator of phage lambda lysogenization HflD